jgi:hypothetical protein
MGKCGFNQLLSFSHQNPHHDLVVGFSPSGWNWAKVSKRKYRESGILHTSRAFEKIVAVALPYSEHSSFCELVDCVSFFRPKHVVPTVHNTGRSKEVISSYSFKKLFLFRSLGDCQAADPVPPIH